MRHALQREILSAIDTGDDGALRLIAIREGIDPALWDYWLRTMRAIDALSKGFPAIVSGTALIDDEDAQA